MGCCQGRNFVAGRNYPDGEGIWTSHHQAIVRWRSIAGAREEKSKMAIQSREIRQMVVDLALSTAGFDYDYHTWILFQSKCGGDPMKMIRGTWKIGGVLVERDRSEAF